MSIQGIGGSANIQTSSIATLIGSGDMESVLLAFGVERAQNMEDAVKSKIGDMRARNESINELRLLMSSLRTTEPNTMAPDKVAAASAMLDPKVMSAATTAVSPEVAAQAQTLQQTGQSMASWGSVGGRSWMDPNFKDVLDAAGIPHKASNMDKSAMSNASGGWHVSYPTAEYHQLGREVQAKAATILEGKDPKFPPTHINFSEKLPNNMTLEQTLAAGGIPVPTNASGKPITDPAALKAKAEAIIAGTDPQHPPTHINLDAPSGNSGKTMLEVLQASGIPLPTGPDGKPVTSVTPEQIKTLMENLETEVDRLTSNDQLDMISLQSMISKQNNALEMLSNLTSKFANLNDKIVGNMR